MMIRIIIANSYIGLTGVSHCFKQLTYTNSLKFHNHLQKRVLLLLSFCGWGMEIRGVKAMWPRSPSLKVLEPRFEGR